MCIAGAPFLQVGRSLPLPLPWLMHTGRPHARPRSAGPSAHGSTTPSATQVFGNHGAGPRCLVAPGSATPDSEGRATKCLGTEDARGHSRLHPPTFQRFAWPTTGDGATALGRMPFRPSCGPASPGGRPRARDRAPARSPGGGRRAGSGGAKRRRLDPIQPNSAVLWSVEVTGIV